MTIRAHFASDNPFVAGYDKTESLLTGSLVRVYMIIIEASVINQRIKQVKPLLDFGGFTDLTITALTTRFKLSGWARA